MRVAYICRGLFISGAERSLQTILRYAPRAGIDPVVIGIPDDRMAEWCAAEEIPFAGCLQATRDKWRPFAWWGSVRKMRSLLREFKVDLVHTNQIWSFPAAATAARKLGLPRVCHMRDEVHADAVRWWCSPGADLVLCISRHIEQMVKPAFPGTPVETILNPVMLPALVGKEQWLASRRSLGLPEEAMLLGFIGQIIPQKGLLQLLESLAQLAGDRRWHLAVAGKDPSAGSPHEAVCRDKVRQLGLEQRVTFLGFLDNTAPFYRAIDAVVMPSLEEPLGRVPFEAGSHGKPAIAFAAGGLPETIRDGKTGWLVPTGDQAALRDRLAHFLEDPDPAYGMQARAFVETVADPDRYVSCLADHYKRLLARPLLKGNCLETCC